MHRSLCFFLLLLASQQQVLVVGFRNFLRNNGGGLANPLDGLFSISASSRSHTPIEPPLKRRPEPEKCTVGDPCERCEGDCNNDDECGPGLVCFERERGENTAVPGCSGGEDDASRTDYCIRSNQGPPSIIYVRQCSKEEPCGHCEGDCDSDDDCEGDLKCFEREEDESALVPGCMGGRDDPAATDFCYMPPPVDPKVKILNYHCNKNKQCGLCEGDCDEDEDCEGDLKCYHRDRNEFAEVPGCRLPKNKSPSRTDYCYKSCGCCVNVEDGCHEQEDAWDLYDCVMGKDCSNILEFELASGTCNTCESGISCLDKYGAYDGCPYREYTGTGP